MFEVFPDTEGIHVADGEDVEDAANAANRKRCFDFLCYCDQFVTKLAATLECQNKCHGSEVECWDATSPKNLVTCI